MSDYERDEAAYQYSKQGVINDEWLQYAFMEFEPEELTRQVLAGKKYVRLDDRTFDLLDCENELCEDTEFMHEVCFSVEPDMRQKAISEKLFDLVLGKFNQIKEDYEL